MGVNLLTFLHGLEVFYCLNQGVVISKSFSLDSSVVGCAGASGQPQ